jgi:hypothetical protein
MPLTGEAKKLYQRGYMREYMANKRAAERCQRETPALEWHGPGDCGNYFAPTGRGVYTIAATLEDDSLKVPYDHDFNNNDPTIVVAVIPVTAKPARTAKPAKSAKALAKARMIAEAHWARQHARRR